MPKTKKIVPGVSFSSAAYPFSALVAQEEMKLALMLNVIDPSVGGVLIMGHRGTGKSTAVRALADLLPERAIVAGCAYRCDPGNKENLCADCSTKIRLKRPLRRSKAAVSVVELPLGATEDRVVGTIDIEQALRSGVKRFEPGLLARANGGFLYVDEVNLLEDHLVDLLLDVATTGVNKVERESVSVEHPARFVLIGSGNPEEGELRPQLLDRFGLSVEVKTENSLDQRVEIVERREAFERDRKEFRRQFATEQDKLRTRITDARKNGAKVKLERGLLRNIAEVCSELRIDGHRGEITITRAARALAAFEGRKKITDDDVKRVAVMSLRHRLRHDAMEEIPDAQRIEEALNKVLAKSRAEFQSGGGGQGDSHPDYTNHDTRPREKSFHAGASDAGRSSLRQNRNGSTDPEATFGAENDLKPQSMSNVEAGLPDLSVSVRVNAHRNQMNGQLQNRRSTGVKRTIYSGQRGRYSRAVGRKKGSTTVALDATLRALLVSSSEFSNRNSSFNSRRQIASGVINEAIRFKLFKRKPGRMFILAVDLSGSMARDRIALAKSFMVALLRRSYIERDTVAIIGFRGTTAELLLRPSRSILRARRVLDSVSVGGGTPLSAGLVGSLQLARRAAAKSGQIMLWLFTDGQANVVSRRNGIDDQTLRQELLNKEITYLGGQLKAAGVNVIVVDTQNEFRSTGRAKALSEMLRADYRHSQESLNQPSHRARSASRGRVV